MKAKPEHRVPLCVRALEILDVARTLDEGNRLVLPMPSGKAISMSTLPKMLEHHRVAAAPARFPLVVPGLGGVPHLVWSRSLAGRPISEESPGVMPPAHGLP